MSSNLQSQTCSAFKSAGLPGLQRFQPDEDVYKRQDKYDLKEFRGFLLDLSSVDAYTPEQKEQITESLDAIHQAFESISWRSTKGLGAGVTGEYDFLLNDYKEVNKIVTEMNHAEIQIAAD